MNKETHIHHRRNTRPIRAGSRGLIWMVRNLGMALSLFLIFLWIYAPVLWTFSLSLKGIQELYTMPVRFVPHAPSFHNYIRLFGCLLEWLIYFRNSIIASVVAVAITVFCAFLMGYAFARIRFRGRDLIFYSLIATMLAPQIWLLLAQYEVMDILDLRNNLMGLALLFASSLGIPVFIMRQIFLGMPSEIEDAAKMDSANRLRFLLEIALPYATNGVLIVAILTFVNVWGDYLITITMIDDQKLYTLGVGMTMFRTCGSPFTQAGTSVSLEGIRAAFYLVVSAPVILLLIMMKDFFSQDSIEGSIKQ